MNDFDLPPERRLSDGVKQQMKRDLINQTAEPAPPSRGRTGWLAAAVAAVAVAVVAVGGAVLLGGDEQSAPDPAQPAGSGTAGDPAPSSSPSDPKAAAEAEARQRAREQLGSLSQEGPADCKADVAALLPGATKRGAATYEAGVMELWGTDAKWVVCDDWPERTFGTAQTTLIGTHPWSDAPLTKELFQISMNFSESEAQYFSGGPVPDGVEKIEYRFSDGKTVAAEIGAEMWTMVRISTDGPFGPAGGAPISATVVVTRAGGQIEEFQLKDPGSGELRDFCAQLNHGC